MESMIGSAQSKGEFMNALSMPLPCYQLIKVCVVGCGISARQLDCLGASFARCVECT